MVVEDECGIEVLIGQLDKVDLVSECTGLSG